MPPRKLREPSMPPSMEKVRGEKLRTGWTTGTCAAAAARAAAKSLVSGRTQSRVDVKLPGKGAERRVEFEVERASLEVRGPRPSSSRTRETTQTLRMAPISPPASRGGESQDSSWTGEMALAS
jgi:hypothetical protein